MKVKHPEKYNGKLTAAMRAAILAGAVAVTGGCAVDKNPVMGDVPAPEPISTNDSPEEFITIGEIPSEIIEGMLPAEPEPVEEETLPQDVVFSEEMLTPRMVAIPAALPAHLKKVANLPAHLEKVANEAVVEQPKGEDEKEIIIERILGKPAPASMDLPPEPTEPTETILRGVPVPTMPPSSVSPTTKEDSAAEDAKAREELDELIQEIAKEKAEADKAKAKE